MKIKNVKASFIVLLLFSCNVTIVFALSKEATSEKKEGILEVRMAQSEPTEPAQPQIAYRAGVFAGYDSNVLLASDSKGDIFEEFFFSLNFRKQLAEDLKLTFDYNLDNINYNEFTRQSNLINHLRIALHKKLSFLTIGSGYEFAFFYYPRRGGQDQDFLSQKGIIYIKHDISRKAYQQLQFEASQKDYTGKDALSYTIDTFQDKEQRDKRLGVEYNIGTMVWPRLFMRLKAKFYKNDSNARYQNFYDYQAYEVSPFLRYRLLANLDIYSGFAYISKDYKSRLITLGGAKQEDIIYSANLGLNCRLDKKNTLILSYTYRDNSSNDPFAEYTDHIISCGWQYSF